MTFAEYAAKPFFPECQPPDLAVKLLGTVCLCFLTAINCLSVKWSMKIQDVFTAGKLIALVLITLTGVVWMFMGNTENFENMWEGNYSADKVGFAFYSGLFAFGGWNYLNFVTEELQDPYKWVSFSRIIYYTLDLIVFIDFRNLPRAIWIAMPIVTIIYVLVNLAYFAVVPKIEMLSSLAVAITFGNRMYGALAFCIPIFVALSTFGGVNGVLFTSARLFATGAQEGHLPKFFGFFHTEAQTPIPSLLFTVSRLKKHTYFNFKITIYYFSVPYP